MDALLALDSYILPASGSSLVSCLSTPSALDLVPMVLNLREATAMPAVERRASWLAGPLHVLRSVLLLAVARREALLLGAPSGRSSTSYRVASSTSTLRRRGLRTQSSTSVTSSSCLFFGRGSAASWRS